MFISTRRQKQTVDAALSTLAVKVLGHSILAINFLDNPSDEAFQTLAVALLNSRGARGGFVHRVCNATGHKAPVSDLLHKPVDRLSLFGKAEANRLHIGLWFGRHTLLRATLMGQTLTLHQIKASPTRNPWTLHAVLLATLDVGLLLSPPDRERVMAIAQSLQPTLWRGAKPPETP